jgi:hypothetical protein
MTEPLMSPMMRQARVHWLTVQARQVMAACWGGVPGLSCRVG